MMKFMPCKRCVGTRQLQEANHLGATCFLVKSGNHSNTLEIYCTSIALVLATSMVEHLVHYGSMLLANCLQKADLLLRIPTFRPSTFLLRMIATLFPSWQHWISSEMDQT